MALNRTLHNTFAGGEMSPLLRGRTDQEGYYNKLDTCENWIPLVSGGATVRPGTILAGTAKAATAVRLIPFTFSAADTLMMEFGDLYVRFWRHNATTGLPEQIGPPTEVVTPYTAAELPFIQYRQSADVVFLDHANHPPATLSRLSADGLSWSYVASGLNPPPTYQAGLKPAATLESSAATGAGVNLKSSVAVFLQADVGRQINVTVSLAGKQVGQAVANVTAFVDTSNLTADIIQGAFPLAGLPAPAGTWWIGGSPAASLDIRQTSGAALGTSPGAGQLVNLYLQDVNHADINGWRAGDVGSYVLAFDGTFVITAFTSAVIVVARCVSTPRSFVLTVHITGSGTWTLEVQTWTAGRGYPAAVGIAQQRVLHGGSQGEPDTMRGSAIGDYYSFPAGVLDDQALNFTLATGTVCPIQWFESLQNLVVGTLSRLFFVGPHSGAAVTPTAPGTSPQSGGGACYIAPVVLESAILFVMRGQRQVGELAYSLSDDAGIVDDKTEWASHLTLDVATQGDRLFTQNALQEQPVPIVWYVRADGTLCGLTYRRAQKMVAWHRATTWRGATQDVFESAAAIANRVTGKDHLWVSVVRGALHTIEVFDAVVGIPSLGRTMDASVVYNGAATATVTGLSVLEGLTVGIRGKDAAGVWRLYPDQVVTGGQVTALAPPVVWAEVGLRFTATLVIPRLELHGGGSEQGRVKSYGQGFVRTYNTVALTVQGFRYPVGWYNASAPSIYPPRLSPPADDRDLTFSPMGVDTDGRVTIVQDLPLGGTVTLFGAECEIGH